MKNICLIINKLAKKAQKTSIIVDIGSNAGEHGVKFSSSKNIFFIDYNNENLNKARENHLKHGLKNKCFCCFISIGKGFSKQKQITFISLDEFLKENKINKVFFLFTNICSNEVLMLHGANFSLKSKMIKNLLIQTHSDNVHNECVRTLEQYDYQIKISDKIKRFLYAIAIHN